MYIQNQDEVRNGSQNSTDPCRQTDCVRNTRSPRAAASRKCQRIWTPMPEGLVKRPGFMIC